MRTCLDANFVDWNIVKEKSLRSLGCQTTNHRENDNGDDTVDDDDDGDDDDEDDDDDNDQDWEG